MGKISKNRLFKGDLKKMCKQTSAAKASRTVFIPTAAPLRDIAAADKLITSVAFRGRKAAYNELTNNG